MPARTSAIPCMTARSISPASRRASGSMPCGARSPISTRAGSRTSSAATSCCPMAVSALSARSSPASNCGITTISSRRKRNWCCEARSWAETMKKDKNGKNCNGSARAPAESERFILGKSQIFTPEVINDIHVKSELGRYRMRGFSLFKKIPHWDDLTFLPGTLTRFVIEGYREKCITKTVLGPRAKRPLVLDIPVYITGMSFGALSYEAKIALARGATMAGSATCSGEGGMIPDERRYSAKWYYQCIQSRYGFNPHHLRLADAVEFFIGQGCKVGLGGHLMGQKVTDQVAEMRSLPAGIDQRSPARHPDWLGPDDLALEIEEIREATNWEIPIQLKLGAARVYDDVRMAAKTGPDMIYIDGMEGSTGAGPHLATEDTGVPGIAAIRQARKALDDVGKTGEISLIYAGGIRNGSDIAKALALGADAVAIGHSALMALNCNKAIPEADYPSEVGVEAGYCYHCHTGRCPVGVATQDPALRKRLDPDKAAERVYNFLHTLTMECQMMARACGKTNIHSLEPEDLAALTMEASALAMVPLAGTQHTVGRPDMTRY